MTISTSSFSDSQAKREQCPLLLGLVGPSGSGKTYSALELATGIASVRGGDIFYIDTEARRALHYADMFNFRHVPFAAPFNPSRYKAAIDYCISKGAGCIIIDSMTHEHSGEGGVLDMAESFLEEKCGSDFNKRERMKLISWAKPKAERKSLNNYIIQIGAKCPIIMCYRAHEKMDFVNKVDGKPRQLGFQPETTSPLMYEMVQQFLLRPGCDGVPELRGNTPEEKLTIKSPSQFRDWFRDSQRLDAAIGARFAKWSIGDAGSAPQAPPSYRDDADAVIAAIEQSDTLEAVKAVYGAFYKQREQYSATDCASIAAAKDAAKSRLEG